MNYLKKMVLFLFTAKISSRLQLKCSRYPEIRKELFQSRNKIPYSLRQRSQFHIPPARIVFRVTESIKFLGFKVWEHIADEMKELESLWELKRTVREWKPTSYPCRLRKQYF